MVEKISSDEQFLDLAVSKLSYHNLINKIFNIIGIQPKEMYQYL